MEPKHQAMDIPHLASKDGERLHLDKRHQANKHHLLNLLLLAKGNHPPRDNPLPNHLHQDRALTKVKHPDNKDGELLHPVMAPKHPAGAHPDSKDGEPLLPVNTAVILDTEPLQANKDGEPLHLAKAAGGHLLHKAMERLKDMELLHPDKEAGEPLHLDKAVMVLLHLAKEAGERHHLDKVNLLPLAKAIKDSKELRNKLFRS